MPSYASEWHRFVDAYRNGGSLRAEARQITLVAQTLYQRAKVVRKLPFAEALRAIGDSAMEAEPPQGDIAARAAFVQAVAYDYLADDFLIMAAFEMLSKARLLKRRYAVHVVKEPSNLKNSQRKKPLHFATISAADRRNRTVVFSEQTLSTSTLLSTHYAPKLGIEQQVLEELDRINRRRNKIHLDLAGAFSIDARYLQAVRHLGELIEADLG